MDYPFFIGKIGTLDTSAFKELRQLALIEDGYLNHHYFRNDEGQQLSNKLLPWTRTEELPVAVRNVLAQAGLDTLSLASASFNRLGGHSEIGEHSDLNSGGELAWHKIHRHIVHIPITNPNARYLHRRSSKSSNSEFRMELGSVYVFNNYVWHTVVNPTEEPRINLLIELEDRRWSVRDQLLERFGIFRGGKQYECKTPYLTVLG